MDNKYNTLISYLTAAYNNMNRGLIFYATKVTIQINSLNLVCKVDDNGLTNPLVRQLLSTI